MGRDAVAPFGGDGLVTSIVPLLAVIVAGSVRAARGIAGAKSLLVAPDLGIAALAGATWALSDPRFVDDPGWLYAATSRRRSCRRRWRSPLPSSTRRGGRARRAERGPCPRRSSVLDAGRDRQLTRWALSGAEVTDIAADPWHVRLALVGRRGRRRAHRVVVGVSLAARDRGDRERRRLAGRDRENPETISAHKADAAIAAIAVALGLVAVASARSCVRARPESTAIAARRRTPTVAALPRSAATRRRPSTPAAVWSIVGAILYPLLVLVGLFPAVNEAALVCVPAAPGQDVLVALTLVSVVAVPVSTVILLLAAGRPVAAGRPRSCSGPGCSRPRRADPRRARLHPVRLPVRRGRPGGARGTRRVPIPVAAARPPARGAVCSLAAAGSYIAWFAGTRRRSIRFGFDPGLAVGSIPAGLLLPLAIAWEGDRAARLSNAATSAPAAPIPPAPPLAENPARPGTIGPADPLDTPAGGP